MEAPPNPIPATRTPTSNGAADPRGTEPFTFATGRLFHEDRAVVTLLAARQSLLTKGTGSERKALVVSNPAGAFRSSKRSPQYWLSNFAMPGTS